MAASVLQHSQVPIGEHAFLELLARALNDAKRFRALAWIALRDGSPNGELRAANARAAARSIIGNARALYGDSLTSTG